MAERPDQQVNVRKRVPDDAPPPDEAQTVQEERIVRGDEVEATRAEIEQTRAEMTETIDALQNKLDPEKIKAQAKTRATSTVRDTGAKAAERARQNPAIPLAVGGGILGLLLLRSLLRGRGDDGTVVFDLKRGTTRRG